MILEAEQAIILYDKFGQCRISAYKPIHLNQPQELDKANLILQKKPIGPKASAYYSRLQFIDFNEAQQLYPIAEAIRSPLKTVITYFHYNGKKAM